MGINITIKNRIKNLKKRYDELRLGKSSLLTMLDEAELPEAVYNSNAIENSTLTLKETEKILMEMEVSRDIDLREVFEAKNLARVTQYVRDKIKQLDLSEDEILLFHKMLISNINDSIAGRFRKNGEYVRVGTHIASAPEKIKPMLKNTILEYKSDQDNHLVEKISRFHLDFETIHPFNDGNGRIGRVIMNYQFAQAGFPIIIIRNNEKRFYYRAFTKYNDSGKTKEMDKILSLALLESLHKRIAYLSHTQIITLAEYSKKQKRSLNALINSAKRQSIPAFREKGIWKIGV